MIAILNKISIYRKVSLRRKRFQRSNEKLFSAGFWSREKKGERKKREVVSLLPSPLLLFFFARPISRATRNREIAFRSLETLATQATVKPPLSLRGFILFLFQKNECMLLGGGGGGGGFINYWKQKSSCQLHQDNKGCVSLNF